MNIVKNKMTRQIHKKGWLATQVAERWGITPRRLHQIAQSPKQIHIDGVNGLPIRLKGRP